MNQGGSAWLLSVALSSPRPRWAQILPSVQLPNRSHSPAASCSAVGDDFVERVEVQLAPPRDLARVDCAGVDWFGHGCVHVESQSFGGIASSFAARVVECFEFLFDFLLSGDGRVLLGFGFVEHSLCCGLLFIRLGSLLR